MATTKDFFSPPALSLTLAGIFRNEEESVGDGKRQRDEHLSDDNSGPLKSLSDDDLPSPANLDDENHSVVKKKKKKNYHRHTADQIRDMEALFKESPHPDEKQRQQLSKQLGLAPRQVKFWFQNRRTQIKAVQERHENSLLRLEIEKLREENKCLRESIGGMSSCSNCGFSLPTQESSRQCSHILLENGRLKAELEKVRMGKDEEDMNGVGSFDSVENKRRKEPKIMEMVEEGVEELKIMASEGDPLWVTNLESGREILNYDEYMRRFGLRDYCCHLLPLFKQSIEASRESAIVFADILHLVRSFIDVDLWKDVFPFIISKASVIDIMCEGDENDYKNGITQLMVAELHMLTPLVPVREVYFVRHCRRIGIECWIVVDLSVDGMESRVDASLANCKKRPSGCIIEDKVNGHCKVTWVEHLESDKSVIPLMYRSIVNSGQAFGASHWIATLKLQCERLAFFAATNVPSKDIVGVNTLAGRRSILGLAQRMTREFCQVVGASNNYTCLNTAGEKSDDVIKGSSRRNLNYSGEPIGLLICLTISVWLPVSPSSLFSFLKDNRTQWDSKWKEGGIGSIARLVKGKDGGNVVTIQGVGEEEGEEEEGKWVIQDCYKNGRKESMIVYASVDIPKMKGVMEGCSSSDIAILPSGFSIMPDGIQPHPPFLITTTRERDEEKSMQEEEEEECGSLLTLAFQSLVVGSTATSTSETANLLSVTLHNIRRGLRCQGRMI